MKVRAADARAAARRRVRAVGALMEPLANGVHAVRLGARAGVERAVVLGAGTIGLVTLQAALLDGHPARRGRRAADERRARAARSARTPLRRARGGASDAASADLVLDAVGAQATRALGLELLRPGGTMVCIGLAADDTTLGFHDVVRSQHRIQGSYAYTMADFEQAHEWLVSGAGVARRRPRPRCGRWRTGRTQFARLAEGPPPPEFKVFLAGAGREREPHGRRGRRLVGHRPRDGARVRRRRATRVHAAARREIDRAGRRPRTGSTSPTATAVAALRGAVRARRRADRRRRRRTSSSAGCTSSPHESWDRMIGANLTGPFNVAARVPADAARGARDVVIIASVSGAYTDRSGPAYQAAKAGALALSHGAGFEVDGEVRCTAILPGVVDTAILDNRPEPPTPRCARRCCTPRTSRRRACSRSRCRRALRPGADDPADRAAGDRPLA